MKTFAIHGGGNIGLGLLADVIFRGNQSYQMIATSNDPLVTKLINEYGEFHIAHRLEQGFVTTKIKNVKIISRNTNDIIELYSQADVAALCLTPSAFQSSLNSIAQALIARIAKHNLPLEVMVLMNLPNAAHYVSENINKTLLKLKPKDQVNLIMEKIKFVPTIIDRIVTRISETTLCKTLEEIFPNESVKTIDDILKVVKKYNYPLALFNAERMYSFYVPQNFLKSQQFPTIKRVKNIKALEELKNKYINGPHAVLAWLGALFNCQTIAESIRYPGMKTFIENLMKEEIAPVLKAAFPTLKEEELDNEREMFIRRCYESTHDPVTRVGRDPLRKIDDKERIRGTIALAKKLQLGTPTKRLEQGVAAALLYALRGKDPTNASCKQMVTIFKDNDSRYCSILCYRGPTSDGEFKGLDPIKEKDIINNVLLQLGHFIRELSYFEGTNRKQKNVFFKGKNETSFNFEGVTLEPLLKYNNRKSLY